MEARGVSKAALTGQISMKVLMTWPGDSEARIAAAAPRRPRRLGPGAHGACLRGLVLQAHHWHLYCEYKLQGAARRTDEQKQQRPKGLQEQQQPSAGPAPAPAGRFYVAHATVADPIREPMLPPTRPPPSRQLKALGALKRYSRVGRCVLRRQPPCLRKLRRAAPRSLPLLRFWVKRRLAL